MASRRGTYDAPPRPNDPAACGRGTYEVYRSGGAESRGCADADDDRTVTFTLTGTLTLPRATDAAGVHRPPSPPPRHDRRSSVGPTLEQFLDMDCGVAAPRSLAAPGCPYVHIDEDASTVSMPDRWRRIIEDRDSLIAEEPDAWPADSGPDRSCDAEFGPTEEEEEGDNWFSAGSGPADGDDVDWPPSNGLESTRRSSRSSGCRRHSDRGGLA